jgi:superfamily II DNA or RNA helicase
MYNGVFKLLGIMHSPPPSDQIPLLGLTATPFRAYNISETNHLRDRYGNRLLRPSGPGFDERWKDWDFIKQELERRGVLAKVDRRIIDTKRIFEMSLQEFEEFQKLRHFKDSLLSRIGSDLKRNKLVLDELIRLSDEKKSILFFGASVSQAKIVSAFLNGRDIKSAVITGDTGTGPRQVMVRLFREQKIKVLCNFGVLTTGFDAPKIDAVMIARPAESPNLYEQMVGRGLRGPRFGGKESCTILDLVDNIYHDRGHRIIQGSEEFWRGRKPA